MRHRSPDALQSPLGSGEEGLFSIVSPRRHLMPLGRGGPHLNHALVCTGRRARCHGPRPAISGPILSTEVQWGPFLLLDMQGCTSNSVCSIAEGTAKGERKEGCVHHSHPGTLSDGKVELCPGVRRTQTLGDKPEQLATNIRGGMALGHLQRVAPM